MGDPLAPSFFERSRSLLLFILIAVLAFGAFLFDKSKDARLAENYETQTHTITGFTSTNDEGGGIPFVHTVDPNGTEFSIRTEQHVAKQCVKGQAVEVEVRGVHARLRGSSCDAPGGKSD